MKRLALTAALIATCACVGGSSTDTAPITVKLKGLKRVITLADSPAGPRFTIASPDGKVIATLSPFEMQRQHPDLYNRYMTTLAAQHLPPESSM